MYRGAQRAVFSWWNSICEVLRLLQVDCPRPSLAQIWMLFGMLGGRDRLVTCQDSIEDPNIGELYANSIKAAVASRDETSVTRDLWWHFPSFETGGTDRITSLLCHVGVITPLHIQECNYLHWDLSLCVLYLHSVHFCVFSCFWVNVYVSGVLGGNLDSE